MRIGFFGDVHCKYDLFYDILLDSVKNKGISAAFQVGDFGLCDKMLIHNQLLDLPVPLYLIDGNHEDFRFIKKYLNQRFTKQCKGQAFNYQSRGSSVSIGGINAGFIGGALHVDQPQLRKNGNVITNDDVNYALREFSRIIPDIVISHSCPAGIGIGMHGQPSHAWGVANYIIMEGYSPGPSFDYGEVQLTDLWERLLVKPRLWIFGHFHQFYQAKIKDTLFICIPRIDYYHQMVIWDTETDKIEINGEDGL